jgi:hypothetical protein
VRAIAADHFRDVASAEFRITGIFALRGIGEKEIPLRAQAGALQDRLHDLAGGAGISRRFEHDQLTAPQMGGQ